MDKTPLFSVLIANYNNGQYLQECLDSVFAQTYTNWEVIIVDDASTDDSRDIYNKYKDNKRIKVYYNKENKGAGYTKRRCAELATGVICGFLDPDDAVTNDALGSMVKTHLNNPECSLVYSRHYACDKNLVVQYIINTSQIASNETYLTSDKVVSHFVSYKNSLYKKTQGISKIFKAAVDQDLYFKLEEVGKLKFLNKPLYLYRKNDNGISQGENSLKALRYHLLAIENAAKRRGIKVNSLNTYKELKQRYLMRSATKYLELKEYNKMQLFALKSLLLKPFDKTYLKFNLLLHPYKLWKK